MDLISMLPVLEGWAEVRISDDKELTQDSPTVTVYQSEASEQGWLLGVTFQSDQPDAELDVAVAFTGGAQVNYSLNPGQLYALHRFSPNRVGPYVAVYDDSSNIYSAVFEPSAPLAYSGRLTITAVRGSADANVNYEVALIRITDVDTFTDSLRRALGVTGVANQLDQLLGYEYISANLLKAIAQQRAVIKVEEVVPAVQIPTPNFQRKPYQGFLP